MRNLTIALALTAALLAAPAVRAEETIDATDPEGILDVARHYGEATLLKDGEGDPLINGSIDGTSYQLFFYGCSENRNCTTLMFTASWEVPNLTDKAMATWNRDKRFGNAYIDGDGFPTVEMNVNLLYGVTRRNLDDTIDWWKLVLNEFAEYYDF